MMRRKHHVKSIILSALLIISMATLGGLILFTTPESPWLLGVFTGTVGCSVVLLIVLVLGNYRAGIIMGVGISMLVGLRLMELDTPLNILLTLALMVTCGVYFKKEDVT